MTSYDWQFSILLQPAVRAALLAGLLMTLGLTAASVAIGTPLGIAGGVLALAGRQLAGGFRRRAQALTLILAFIRSVVVVVLDVIRAIPLLLLILICYYGLPQLLNAPLFRFWRVAVGSTEIRVSPVASVVVAMSMNLAAFVADLVRAAALAVPRGSLLAARALGMHHSTTWRRIILPHVMREILPGLALLYITMLKLSTLASVVAIYELLHTADNIIQSSYRTLELYVALCVIFILIVVPLSSLARRMERVQAFRRRT
jgi:ABC-type amino acid transport system permease subunit